LGKDQLSRQEATPYLLLLRDRPIIGGLFADPAATWPDSLGRIPYLVDRPYFLPCFIAAMAAFIAFVIGTFGLKEVGFFFDVQVNFLLI